MLTEEQMFNIQDEELNELYQDDALIDQFEDKYSDYCDYTATYDVLVTEDDTKEIEYEVTIPIEDLHEACISDMYRWLNDPKIVLMFMNDDTYRYTETQYREFCQRKLGELIDDWMKDKAIVRGLNTYSDFAYEYCDEHGSPIEYYPEDYD